MNWSIATQLPTCSALELLVVHAGEWALVGVQVAERNGRGRQPNKSRIREGLPRASSRYNLKIPTPASSSPASELRPRRQQNGSRRTHRCKTSKSGVWKSRSTYSNI